MRITEEQVAADAKEIAVALEADKKSRAEAYDSLSGIEQQIEQALAQAVKDAFQWLGIFSSMAQHFDAEITCFIADSTDPRIIRNKLTKEIPGATGGVCLALATQWIRAGLKGEGSKFRASLLAGIPKEILELQNEHHEAHATIRRALALAEGELERSTKEIKETLAKIQAAKLKLAAPTSNAPTTTSPSSTSSSSTSSSSTTTAVSSSQSAEAVIGKEVERLTNEMKEKQDRASAVIELNKQIVAKADQARVLHLETFVLSGLKIKQTTLAHGGMCATLPKGLAKFIHHPGYYLLVLDTGTGEAGHAAAFHIGTVDSFFDSMSGEWVFKKKGTILQFYEEAYWDMHQEDAKGGTFSLYGYFRSS